VEELVRKKVKAIVCLGVDNKKIIDYFKNKKELIYDTHNLKDCMEICNSLAENGDSVLLSPCCASFDLFENYEDRGTKFKQEVLKRKKIQ
jgi:UDP-N-acetylmuramoylalanine--D-glutamate ligase